MGLLVGGALIDEIMGVTLDGFDFVGGRDLVGGVDFMRGEENDGWIVELAESHIADDNPGAPQWTEVLTSPEHLKHNTGTPPME